MRMSDDVVKISVIMPVHNTQDYLREALDCLVKQTFTDFEVIIVDDGSTDASPQIISDYCNKYDNFCSIRIENAQGAGNARNVGFLQAKGDYSIFLDSDDIFLPEMLDKAYDAAITNDVDLVIFGFNYLYGSSKAYCNNTSFYEKYIPEYPFLYNPKEFPYTLLMTLATPWNKLVKTDFLKKTGIQFQNIKNANDLFFVFSISLVADRIYFIDEPLLDYRHQRPGNLSEERYKRKSFLHEAFDGVFGFLKKIDITEKNIQYVYNLAMQYCYRAFSSLGEYGRKTFAEELKNIYFPKWNIYQFKKEYFFSDASFYFIQCIKNDKEPMNYFDCLLETGGDYMSLYVDDAHKNYKKIALWGAGRLGQDCLSFFERNNIKIDALIDQSQDKIGSEIKGYMVQSWNEVKESVDIVLITNSKWYSGIKESVGDNVEVVDLMHKLEFMRDEYGNE